MKISFFKRIIYKYLIIILLVILLPTPAIFAELKINEFLAINDSNLTDSDGDYSDWIEIFNTSEKTINLNGWALTDNAEIPEKWMFPNIKLGGKKYIVVFASGKNKTSSDDLHTNFKLNGDGEYLALTKLNTVNSIDDIKLNFPAQKDGFSFGLGSNRQWKFFATPTPGKANESGFEDFVADTKFDKDRGFYDTAFEVNIRCDTPNAKIRYTLDGSKPTSNRGKIYRGPVPISTTTTLRAIAYKPGMRDSNVDTSTYLFIKDIIRQSNHPEGFPSTWNGHAADYEMDQEIVNHQSYKNKINSALKSIPSLSLVLNKDDFFKTGQGIYPKGENIAKATSVELIYSDKRQSVQSDGAIEIVGGSSTRRWKTDKLSMRLKFTSQYGDTKFCQNLFGKETMWKFDTLVIDARLNQVWSYGGGSSPSEQRRRGQNVRDQFVADLQNQMGGYAPHGIHVHVYINGLYWGIYTLHERPDEHFAAHYLGGNEEDYDVMKHRKTTVVSGSSHSYESLISTISKNQTDHLNYAIVKKQLDIPNFIDYMLVNFYVGNTDWSHQNWYASFNRNNTIGRWRFHSWDAEHVLKGSNDNTVSKNNLASPTGFHQKLKVNPEYKILFGDRVHKHFFDRGTLTPKKAAAAYKRRIESIDEAIIAESARWGDNQRDEPYTRDKEWAAEKKRLLDDYFPNRTAIVLEQLRTHGLYPSISAPVLNKNGGVVSKGFRITLDTPKGEIFFTLNGSDPRQKGGVLSRTAISYKQPITVNGRCFLKSRVRYKNQWSSLVEAEFAVDGYMNNLLITEIMYHPFSGQSEFIELKNTGLNTIDLNGVQFTEGLKFTFPNGFKINPNKFAVLVQNPKAFKKQFPEIKFDGVYEGRLSNSNETIKLVDSLNETILNVTYSDQSPWPSTADGLGFSLVYLSNIKENFGDPRNWVSSGIIGGSPGSMNLPTKIKPVWVNEVLANTDSPILDSIEIYNPNSEAIDLSHWFLTDDFRDPKKYAIPSGTMISPKGYLVFNEKDFFYGDKKFALNSNGDEVYIFSGKADGSLTGFSDGFSFGASESGISFGRHQKNPSQPQYPPLSVPTLGHANADPLVGPIVINEIYFNPEKNKPDFIELKNISDQTIKLHQALNLENTWRIRGVDYQFPVSASIPAKGLIIVSNTSELEFKSHFTISDEVQFFGPFNGNLNDIAEEIELLRPVNPGIDADGNEFIPYISVDIVRFDNIDPRATGRNGNGKSLEKIYSFMYGNDANNWRLSPKYPSPGFDNKKNRPPICIAGKDQIIETDSLPVLVKLSGQIKDDSNLNFPFVDIKWSLSESLAPVTFMKKKQQQSEALVYGLGVHKFKLSANDGQYSVSDELSVEIQRKTKEEILIPKGSLWTYLDNGTNQGNKWKGKFFNDSKWKIGIAQLGYGDGDENTQIDYGGNSANKHITTYFRHNFEIDNTVFMNPLEAQIISDDGAIAYLNGKEIHRTNMPNGNIRYNTLASSTIGGDDESIFKKFEVLPNLLVQGKNTLAIEIHQSSQTSSDISFDFILRGYGSNKNQPPKLVPFTNQTVIWPSTVTVNPQVTDDGFPIIPGRINMLWILNSGPSKAFILDAENNEFKSINVGEARIHTGSPSFYFSKPGDYEFIFVANDGEIISQETLTVDVKGNNFNFWQIEQFTTEELNRSDISSQLRDPDGDGMSNYAEYIAGTDPIKSDSRLKIQSIIEDKDNRTIEIIFHRKPHRIYFLQCSSTIQGPWRNIDIIHPSAHKGSEIVKLKYNRIDLKSYFYRLAIPIY